MAFADRERKEDVKATSDPVSSFVTSFKGFSSQIAQLTPSEILLAAQAGVMRQVEDMKLQREPAHGAGHENDWQLNIEGALGECALCKYFGLYWGGKGKFRDQDTPLGDVRTASEQHYSLILHPDDHDERVYWLLTGRKGVYVIRGWLLGKEGKIERFWKDPTGKGRPAYFVPQNELHSPETKP